MTMVLTLAVMFGCKQTAEDRYERYLEEVADSMMARVSIPFLRFLRSARWI